MGGSTSGSVHAEAAGFGKAEVGTTSGNVTVRTEAFDELKIGGASADYRAAHTNFNKRESDSCLSGRMYEYTYPDFVVLANEDNGVEKIESIKLTGPGVSTREGIHVDSTLEEVMKAYGEETSVNYFCKTTADGKLEIYVEHGIVMEIELTAA